MIRFRGAVAGGPRRRRRGGDRGVLDGLLALTRASARHRCGEDHLRTDLADQEPPGLRLFLGRGGGGAFKASCQKQPTPFQPNKILGVNVGRMALPPNEHGTGLGVPLKGRLSSRFHVN